MKGRRLKPDELELWQQVAKTTDRPSPDPTEFEKAIGSDLTPRQSRKPKQPDPIPSFRMGEKSTATAMPNDLVKPIAQRVGEGPVHMDQKAFRKMKRGKLTPDARLDLHGMTLDRAHPTLTRFILQSQSNGCRLVLVITGKGKSKSDTGPIPQRLGVLRHQVPQWLAMPPLSSAVLQVSQANLRHGGGGAYYVYLRKSRR